MDPFAIIAARVGKPTAAPVTDRAPVTYLATAGTAYAQRALEAECERVAGAQPGERNHTLNRAAFSLGQLVAGGALAEDEVVHALTLAARQVGLADSETTATLRSGLRGGSEQPRGVPEKPDVDGWVATLPATPTGVDPATGEVLEVDEQALAAARADIVRERLPALDWHKLWADTSEEEWIVEPLLPARRLVALYSAPKVGKSLLMLELAVAISRGTPVLGVDIDRPRRVLYVDFENDPKADVRERLQALGVGPDDLDGLKYLSFPTLAALDSDRGGQELMAAVAAYECEVVVVDTVSRSIAGEENENDTWLNFYRHTGLRMKQQGVALIRLDHSGKDESKGQRGGSAKSGDVDAVWRMSRVTDDSYRLDCEAARMPVTEKTLVLHREQGPLRHRVDAEGRSAIMRAVKSKAHEMLDDAGLPYDAGRDKARAVVKAGGLRIGNGPLGEVCQERRDRGPRPVREVADRHPFADLSGDSADRSRTGQPR